MKCEFVAGKGVSRNNVEMAGNPRSALMCRLICDNWRNNDPLINGASYSTFGKCDCERNMYDIDKSNKQWTTCYLAKRKFSHAINY